MRKSKAQFHKVVFSPRWGSLDRSLFGRIVLKAELKSKVSGSCPFFLPASRAFSKQASTH